MLPRPSRPIAVTEITAIVALARDREVSRPVRGGVAVPDLVRYQLRDGPHAGEPTTERGEIERLARACRAAACLTGLGSTVVETRFNVVRSGVPVVVETARKLRDYLPPDDSGRIAGRADGLASASMP
jgi:hypothetical protein